VTIQPPPGHQPGRVIVSLPRWLASMLDPGAQAFIVLGGLVIAGFVMLGFAWHGAAGTIYVPLQVPWFVSGSLAGLAVTGMGLGGWSVHLARRQDAAHRDAVETLVRDAVELAERVRHGRDVGGDNPGLPGCAGSTMPGKAN
jgi:hypothetical protein